MSWLRHTLRESYIVTSSRENIDCSPEDRIKDPVVINWGLATVTNNDTTAAFRATPGFASVSSLGGNGQNN